MTYRPIINVSSMSRGYGYTVGGYASGVPLTIVEKYDDISNTWVVKTDMYYARYGLCGFSLNGYGYAATGYIAAETDVTEKYDDIADNWTAKAVVNTARYSPASFTLNNYGYVAGGTVSDAIGVVNEKYDDAANTWTAKTSLSTARDFTSGFALNAYGYIAGGYIGYDDTTPVVEKYDDITDTWTTKTSLNTSRSDLGAFALNGYGYTASGYTTVVVDTTEKYDDIADTWTAKGVLNTARSSTVDFALNGYGYCAAGFAGGESVVTEKYDDIADTWTAKADLNIGRSYSSGFAIGSLQADIKNPETIPVYKVLNRKSNLDANKRMSTNILPTKIINAYWHASWDERTVVQGTWGQGYDGNILDYDLAWVSSGGNNWGGNTSSGNLDEVHFGNLTLTAGTYKVIIAYTRNTYCGIVEVLHGTTSLGTSDLYGSLLYNQVASYTYSPTTLVTGNLRLRANSKNGSSSGYILYISRVEIIRTG